MLAICSVCCGARTGKTRVFLASCVSRTPIRTVFGCVVNPDTGEPVIADEGRLTSADFEKMKISEAIENGGGKACRQLHSPLWQADADKIRRMAPIEFIGRYMPEWFDYAICDEIHQLAGDTAQGNALGTLASCTDRIVGLTGTLLGAYADDLFNTLF